MKQSNATKMKPDANASSANLSKYSVINNVMKFIAFFLISIEFLQMEKEL